MDSSKKSLRINEVVAHQLIETQFPEFAGLPIVPVKKQGHDNRTYRLGNEMLIRLPTAQIYALKVPIEQALLPQLKPHLPVMIPVPIKMGHPSELFPFPFSIYQWLPGESADHVCFTDEALGSLALQLAYFLKALHRISDVKGPAPGEHNWWRGDHLHVYDDGARKQIAALVGVIDASKAIEMWNKACETKWAKAPVWVHGDFAAGNILLREQTLTGVIDFGGMAVGDPACDLVIAWTLLKGQSFECFKAAMDLDENTWLRARAWGLWKATFELCQIADKNSHAARRQKDLIAQILSSAH